MIDYNLFLFVLIREYKRRTLIDRKDLLVKMKTPGLNENDDDDDDVRKLKQQQEQIQTKGHSLISDNDEENESNSISQSNENEQLSKQKNLSESSSDLLSDSSASSIADEETSRINELYANVGDKIDGKHRIKIKGDEIKIKGRSNKQRSNILNSNFFQSNNTDMNLKNSGGEPDLTSFDFLNEYDEKS